MYYVFLVTRRGVAWLKYYLLTRRGVAPPSHQAGVVPNQSLGNCMSGFSLHASTTCRPEGS